MLAPDISRLRASAFPSLANVLIELCERNICTHSPLITEKTIDLRLKCASTIKTEGLTIAEAHSQFHTEKTRKSNGTLNVLRFRERKQLTKYKNEVIHFFPGKISEPGARLISDDEIASSKENNFILDLEVLRPLLLTNSCLKSIQRDYAMAQQAQKDFIDLNNNDPLINCAILLGPEVPWMRSPEALDQMLHNWDADISFKPVLLSSILLTAIDPSVFIFSLRKIKKSRKILEAIEIKYYEWLNYKLKVRGQPCSTYDAHCNIHISYDSEDIILSGRQDFIYREIALFFQRAFELIIQHVQISLLTILEDKNVNSLVVDAKGMLLRNYQSSASKRDKFAQEVLLVLESDKKSLCRDLLKPWPKIVFDKKWAFARLTLHQKSVKGAERLKDSKREIVSYNSIGRTEEESDSIEIGKLDESLVAASGATQSYRDVISEKSRVVRLKKILICEVSLLKDKRKLAQKISTVLDMAQSSPLKEPCLNYYNALMSKNKSSYESARMGFLEALMEYAPEERVTG